MQRIVWIFGIALCLAANLAAVPIDCNGLTTLQEYIDQNAAGGCFVQDKLFSNFSYTGGGTVSADEVDVDVIFSVLPTTDIHGFTFTTIQGVPVWTVGFTLGYTISVEPPSPLITITAAQVQGLFGTQPNPATIVSTKSNGVVLNSAQGAETDTAIFAGVPSLASSTTVTIPLGGALQSLEENYSQTFVPEPGSMILLGLGFTVLSWGLRRRLPGRKA
jgi:hypothetical protein